MYVRSSLIPFSIAKSCPESKVPCAFAFPVAARAQAYPEIPVAPREVSEPLAESETLGIFP